MDESATLTAASTVVELRKRMRFNLLTKLVAEFASQSAIVRNICAQGLGLRHAAQVRVSSTVSVRIDAPENEYATTIRARVVWSRMSRETDERGRPYYDSGLFILDDSPAVVGLLGRLIRAYGVKDDGSLETKRRMLESRAQERTAALASPRPATSSLPRITPDLLLLIREAQEMIRSNADATAKWLARAKEAMVELGMVAPGTTTSPYRHDVLVVWAYLGGKLELDVVSMILKV